MDENLYYDPQQLLSYNRIISFCIGARGIGKSYSMKRYVIKRFIKTGAQFIYLRLHKSNLKKISQWFNDIRHEFPDHKLEVKGRQFYIDGELCGWAIPLSAWQSEKGGTYPNVETIIFDEFILEKDLVRYPPNVVESLLNIIDTVIRNRNNFRCVCLSNSTTLANPYFIYFNILPDKTKRFNKYKHCVVEIPPSRDFAEERKKTRFGSMIAELEYGRMSLDNEFTHDTETFIERRPKDSKFGFAIVYKGTTLGIWVDYENTTMYVSQNFDPSSNDRIALTKEDADERTLIMDGWRNDYRLFKMVSAFKKGLMRFENQVIRHTAYEMFTSMRIF